MKIRYFWIIRKVWGPGRHSRGVFDSKPRSTAGRSLQGQNYSSKIDFLGFPSPDLWLVVPCRGKIIHQKLTLDDVFIIISHVWPSRVTVWHHFFHPHIFFQAAAQSWLHPPSFGQCCICCGKIVSPDRHITVLEIGGVSPNLRKLRFLRFSRGF